MWKCALSVGLHGPVGGAAAKADPWRLHHEVQLTGSVQPASKVQLTSNMELKPRLAAARRRQGSARIATSGLILAALLLIAAPATALPLGDFGITDPIWFPIGGANTGIGSGHTADYVVDLTSYQFLCAGSGVFIASGACSGLTDYALKVESQVRVLPAIQFPQAVGDPVSSINPFIADTIWTVRNNTDDILRDTLLIFTNVDLSVTALVPTGYPDLINDDPAAFSSGPASAFGLDADFLKILEYSSGGTDYYYGVGELGTLLPDETAEFTVRYIVNNGPMPVSGDQVILPPLSLLAATVPEPSTALLLGSGLLGLAAAGRRIS